MRLGSVLEGCPSLPKTRRDLVTRVLSPTDSESHVSIHPTSQLDMSSTHPRMDVWNKGVCPLRSGLRECLSLSLRDTGDEKCLVSPPRDPEVVCGADTPLVLSPRSEVVCRYVRTRSAVGRGVGSVQQKRWGVGVPRVFSLRLEELYS